MERVGQVPVEDRPTGPQKVESKTRWFKKRSVIIVVLIMLLLASSTSAVAGYLGYRAYHSELTLAQTGTLHLHSAIALLESLQKQPFAPQTVERAQQEFVTALSDTKALEAGLDRYSSIAGFAPVYGARLVAAFHLSAMATDISQAGIGGCKMLALMLSRMGNPLKASASTHGITNTDFTTLSNEYQTVSTSLKAAMNEAVLVQPGDVSFDAHLSKMLQTFQTNIPTIRVALQQADQLFPTLSTLLGISKPAQFLLEIMDSSELRPAGGFIGNYGIATVSGGRLTATHIRDVYLLDKTFELAGHSIPYPPEYSWFARYLAPTSWSLRNSNLDADFPTAAHFGELNFEREGGKVPLQGVVAITPTFIEHVLTITGPINVPEFHVTVTAQNLVSLIHFYQLGEAGSSLVTSPNGQTSQRKYFTELLGEHLLTRVQQFSSVALAKFLQLALYSLHTKDIQIYVNASNAENMLQQFRLGGSIQSPQGDHLFVVDANVANSKANSFIINTVHDQVTIDESGNAMHHTTITYAWTLAGLNYGNQLYQDYMRIYAPNGSNLSRQDGWQPFGTSTAFGSEVWTGFITLVHGQTRTITLQWSSHGAVKSGSNGWHYQYILQRQAGIQRTVTVQVMLPSCATATNSWGGLVTHNKQEASLKQYLNQDLNAGINFTCT
jgi:Protein of unknown function (DUF4012)